MRGQQKAKYMKTLHLETGAFNQELSRLTPAGKIGWARDDHGHLADALCDILRASGIAPVSKWVDDFDFFRILLQFLDEYNRKRRQWAGERRNTGKPGGSPGRLVMWHEDLPAGMIGSIGYSCSCFLW